MANEELKDLVETANRQDIRFLFNRFDCNNLEKAFRVAHELNQKVDKPICKGFIEKDGKLFKQMSKTVWRVGRNYDRNVVLEVDNHDLNNLRELYNFYKSLLGQDFNVFKTLHGFHVIQKVAYKTNDEWLYANSLLLNPSLKLEDLADYVEKIKAFDNSKRNDDTVKDTHKLLGTKEDYIRDFKKSGLFQGTGEFDLLYTIRGICFNKYTLRISKKTPTDKYERVDMEKLT
ncbi:MAG: hypothetical protein WA102_06840 [Candidatus Methanoperedens sp.]